MLKLSDFKVGDTVYLVQGKDTSLYNFGQDKPQWKIVEIIEDTSMKIHCEINCKFLVNTHNLFCSSVNEKYLSALDCDVYHYRIFKNIEDAKLQCTRNRFCKKFRWLLTYDITDSLTIEKMETVAKAFHSIGLNITI